MVKIAIVVDGEDTYPIYRENGAYRIDMGPAMGVSEPMSFPSDAKAIKFLQDAIEYDSMGR